MTDDQLRVIAGGLLHDIGKVIYRAADHKNHSESGYQFLKEDVGIKEKEILNQVRYHHYKSLSQAKLDKQSLAYIIYIADNIAAAMDRRQKDDGEKGFLRDMPLESVFNILNDNDEQKHYMPTMLDVEDTINYPTEKPITYTEGFYAGIREKIKNCLIDFKMDDEHINSLLAILESTMTFLPSSTSKEERADISLYDHVKMTAVIGSCIYEYAQEEGYEDYKIAFVKKAEQFYNEKSFLLYSMDISGIQDFIYTINSKGALKGLRSRSFYLEIMMEHLIDELLLRLGLSRANLIYSGGGHAYLLLPNTKKAKYIIHHYEKEINQWFLEYFQTALYIAGGKAVCSANDLYNKVDGSYKAIFREISTEISKNKMHRYTVDQILALNQEGIPDGERECKICRRSSKLKTDDVCEICWSLEKMSSAILNRDGSVASFYTVLNRKEEGALPLPGDKWLIYDSEKSLRKRMKEDDDYVRAYSKNHMYSGFSLATKLWVGDYVNGNTFEELAENEEGIERLAVMRADVDNLGQAFVRGFEHKKYGDRYVTLSRTATFSRKLSMFFKYHINGLLEHGEYMLSDQRKPGKRKVVIVYSGGDDVFIVGRWDDIIGFAIDLYGSLKEYTQSKLTLSAGIGIYPAKFPISVMAKETGALEDAAKQLPGKNAVALFHKDFTFHWDELIEKVIEEKLKLLQEYFEEFDEKGKAFLYQILELLRNRKDDKINIARYAYLLGRIVPESKGKNESKEGKRKELYNRFSRQMYQWMRDDTDAKELEMAIYLYVYMNRTKEEKDGIK